MASDINGTVIRHRKGAVWHLTAKLTGAGAAALTADEAGNMGGSEIATITRTGVGLHTLKFKSTFPELMALGQPHVWGATDNLTCKVLTWDVTAGTATIKLEVDAVATDAATGDYIHFAWDVRNTGAP
jgi:hypothetical protein